jgi:hypothetical protein
MIVNPTQTQVFDAVFDAINNELFDPINPPGTGKLYMVKKGYKNTAKSVKRLEPFFVMEQQSLVVTPYTLGHGGLDIHKYTYLLGFGLFGLQHDKQREIAFQITPIALDILRPNTFDVFFKPAEINNVDLAPFEDRAEMSWLVGFELVGEVFYTRPR